MDSEGLAITSVDPIVRMFSLVEILDKKSAVTDSRLTVQYPVLDEVIVTVYCLVVQEWVVQVRSAQVKIVQV